MSSRPVILGIVGDSAAGKTTLTGGIAQVLGPENVTVICTDDYHRYDRTQRAELGITALHPDCNYIDIMQQHINVVASWRTDSQASLQSQNGYVSATALHQAQQICHC